MLRQSSQVEYQVETVEDVLIVVQEFLMIRVSVHRRQFYSKEMRVRDRDRKEDCMTDDMFIS